jgi:hypothetical protein
MYAANKNINLKYKENIKKDFSTACMNARSTFKIEFHPSKIIFLNMLSMIQCLKLFPLTFDDDVLPS